MWGRGARGAALGRSLGMLLGAVFDAVVGGVRDAVVRPALGAAVCLALAAHQSAGQAAGAPAPVVGWTVLRPGLEQGELTVAAGRGGLAAIDARAPGRWTALPVRVVLVRVDPRRFAIRLHAAARPAGGAGPWDLDAAPAGAALAVNAGQFTDVAPWGWVVHEGRELQPPGTGALAGALVIDTAGVARVLGAGAIPAARAGGAVREAVQSYPALLEGDGRMPDALRADGRGVDRYHRDARLAVGELRDGRLLFALTRFAPVDGSVDGPDGAVARAFGRLPFGLTTPETAVLLAALGARRAVLLDGGLSAQLLARDAAGRVRRWDGLRKVPLGLVALPR